MSHRFMLTMLFLVSVGLTVGCQPSSTSVDSDSKLTSHQTPLPQDEAVKRHILEKVLRAFVEGARDPVDLQFEAGGVQFQEEISAFYGSSLRLVRYEFVGEPNQGEQVVKLIFDDKANGPLDASSELVETRVYRVVDGGNGTSIVRVK